MFVRNGVNYDREAASRASGVVFSLPSKTQKHMAREADINFIVGRFAATGVLPPMRGNPQLTDFSGFVFDFQEVQNQLVSANRAFMALPSKIRTRFGNDPAQFVAFCSDKENLPELRKMGLAKAEEVKVEPPPVRVEVVEKPPPKAG